MEKLIIGLITGGIMGLLTSTFFKQEKKVSGSATDSKTLWQEIKTFKPKTTKQLRSEGTGFREIIAAWIFIIVGLIVVAGGVYLFLFSIFKLVIWAFEALF